jgi:hypothetical protein
VDLFLKYSDQIRHEFDELPFRIDRSRLMTCWREAVRRIAVACIAFDRFKDRLDCAVSSPSRIRGKAAHADYGKLCTTSIRPTMAALKASKSSAGIQYSR